MLLRMLLLRDGREAGIVKQPCFLRQSNHSYVFSGLFQKVKDEAHYETSHLLCRLCTNIWLFVPSRLSESLLTMAPIMSTEIIGCLSFCRLSVPTGVELNAPPMSYIWLWEAPITVWWQRSLPTMRAHFSSSETLEMQGTRRQPPNGFIRKLPDVADANYSKDSHSIVPSSWHMCSLLDTLLRTSF